MAKHQDPGVPMSGKETVDALADQWGKILAIIMLKLGQTDISITAADMARLDEPCQWTLVPGAPLHPCDIRVRLMPIAEAMAAAKKHKDGFGRS